MDEEERADREALSRARQRCQQLRQQIEADEAALQDKRFELEALAREIERHRPEHTTIRQRIGQVDVDSRKAPGA